MGIDVELIPAATVVITRETRSALEILLVRRNPELPVLGGAWAFPGGHISPKDNPAGENPAAQISQHAAKACAARETAEETGLQLDPGEMMPIARWITPVGITPRFDAWFFITQTEQDRVEVDGREIIDHKWLTAEDAIRSHHRHTITLSPPTFVILSNLTEAAGKDVFAHRSNTVVPKFEPRLIRLSTGPCTVYREDAAYPDGNLDRPGPRHRLCMHTPQWRYIRKY